MGRHARRVLVLDVLDGAAALDATNGESRGISEAAHHPGLPLEGTLQRLVDLGRLLEVDDVDVAVGGAHDAQVVAHVGRVHALLALHRGRGALLPQVPVLDRLVPRARHHHGRAVAVEEAARPHRLVVRANDNILLRAEVADLDVFVGRGGDDFGSVLEMIFVNFPHFVCLAHR